MTSPVTTSSNRTEPKGTAAPAPMEEAHIVEESVDVYSVEAVSLGRPRAAQLIDWHGDRAQYEMLITSRPLVVVDNAGVLELADVGVAAAHLADDGAGGMELTTDFSRETVGNFYYAANGTIVAARIDANELGFVQVGTEIRTYEKV